MKMADEFDQKLNAILNNPAMMQQIASMAQSFSNQNGDTAKKNDSPVGDNDMAALQTISKFASQGNIDRHQQNLLSALTPYLSKDKIRKLENAMRASKMTRIATELLQSQKRSPGR